MKIIKTLLLLTLLPISYGVLAKYLLPFKGGNMSIILGVLTLTLLIPIYGILALVKKQHRIEASMLLVSLPLIFGILFQMMNWPFGNPMVIIGSITLLMISIAILIYSIIQKIKIPQTVLFTVIGFCSLAYCFKTLFWPGHTALIILACTQLLVGIFFVFRGKRELTISKIILGLVISFFLITFATKQSKLLEISRINSLKPEYNHPRDYYEYAWLLYKEGNFEQSKSNIQNALKELNNKENVNYRDFSNNIEYQLKTYQSTINLIENKNWSHLEERNQLPRNN